MGSHLKIPAQKLLLGAEVPLCIRMQGFYRVQIRNKFSGKCRFDSGFYPNVLLTAGMNEMSQRNFMSHCQVGTDGTVPNANQTQLLGHHAGTNTIQDDTNGQQVVTTPYYAWRRKIFRFATGTVAANLTEVGVGWDLTGSTLISRAFILDPITQNPTTVTPLADEFMDVTYELRYYPPSADATSPSITLKSVLYDTITRAAEVNSQFWSDSIGTKIGYRAPDWRAYDGNIGTVLQNPSGNSAGLPLSGYSFSNETYSNNSFEQKMTIGVPWDAWNVPGGAGIRSIRIRTTAGSFQTQFDSNPGGNRIPKTSDQTMIMKWKISWGAYVP